ncbi:hypothetical protein SSX86_006563 [Deinandra increscens subsp. villosa]|uniref:non-specific serine/threonine protein kinase n=1 Tax=Deinandra increscens subsp. villosa TaxID=3103831 RepID=A0AAP0DFI3_9ASTR
MGSSITHLITCFLLLSTPFVVSLTFNLTDIGPQNQNREIVVESPDAINGQGQAIRATYFRQLHLWDSRSGELASFTTNFTFVMDSDGRQYYADGFTFFLAQNNSEIYPGGSMGLPINASFENINTTTQFVAVEFDTFGNRFWDPFVYEYNKSMGEHVGISISSLHSVRYQKWSSNLPQAGVCQAWVKYDSNLKNLSVSFTGFLNNTPFRQDGLSYTVDLRQVLPERVIFGFSGATGALNQNTKVRSWSFDSSNLPGAENNEVSSVPSPDPGNGTHSKVGLVLGSVVGILVTLSLVGGLGFVLWWKKMKNMEKETRFDVDLINQYQMGNGPKSFSYVELAQSTYNFAENKKLGEGGFGGVYKGFLEESNTYIAVKRVSKSSKQGINEYASEVRIISRVRHRNLVQLIGWCHEKGNLLLVYQYMENESLDSHLFKEKSLLTWDTSFKAKLGDFGLAKLVDHEKGVQTTKLAGTIGYMAPECVVTGKATKESDVFSFGVVIFEIACGRKAFEYKANENQIWIVEWIWELYRTDTLLEAVDPRLGLDFNEEEIKHLMIIGLWCVHPDPN